jgi:hypothetical protein
MRIGLIAGLLAVCAAAGLTAQTPAPAQTPTPTSTKPLRHLEYSFSDDYEGVSGYEYNAIGNGTNPSSGVGGTNSSIGGKGTMSVDVLSAAGDGALMIRISEWIADQPHAGDAYTCTVYGNTAVLCPSVPAPSQAEWILLSYLGRQFIDAAPWDAQHHWQRKYDTSAYNVVEDFTMADGSTDKQTIVRETKKLSMHNGGFGTRTEEIQITYDRSMEIPDVVHDEMQSVGTAGSGHGSYDFHLIGDSFAKSVR